MHTTTRNDVTAGMLIASNKARYCTGSKGTYSSYTWLSTIALFFLLCLHRTRNQYSKQTNNTIRSSMCMTSASSKCWRLRRSIYFRREGVTFALPRWLLSITVALPVHSEDTCLLYTSLQYIYIYIYSNTFCYSPFLDVCIIFNFYNEFTSRYFFPY